MQRVLIFFIRAYQYILSPLMSPSCRYTPSCSSYSIEALQRFGFIKGLLLSIKRVFSCHPWHKGGYDPIPDAISYKEIFKKSTKNKQQEH